mmetsp:Transcript_24330/g.35664  ORF Transcript_24330/g.35664 Transcript_24330/m.35664 type:complete len:662 (-) Transcript_24330:230-2215(-)
MPIKYCGNSDACLLSQLSVPLPLNESHRLEVLRESQLLDSNDKDPNFDRYTAMALRLFDAPTCVISLLDVNRVWLKSRVGLNEAEIPRNLAACSYACLPQTSDVMVVLDLSKDPYFSDNDLVTGPQHLRFYAGAALIVDGVKIGTLCMIDTKPWSEFTLAQKQDLQDLSAFVSTLISLQRDQALHMTQAYFNEDMRQSQRNLGLLRLTHNLKTPIANISLASENFLAEVMTARSGINEEVKTSVIRLLTDIDTQISFLHNVVESCLLMVKDLPFQSESGRSDSFDGAVKCEISVLIDKLRCIVSLLGVSFEFDDSTRLKNPQCITYPDLLLVIVLGKICQMLESLHRGVPRSVVTVKLHWSEVRKLMLVRISCAEGALKVSVFKSVFSDMMDLLSSSYESKIQLDDTVVADQWRVLRTVGGNMTLEWDDNVQSARFDFWVPCSVNQPLTSLSHELSVVHMPVKNFPPLKVLIVDDSRDFINKLTNILEMHNCEVSSATNGLLGLLSLKECLVCGDTVSKNYHCKYDVVFVDLQMPTMHGVQMMTEIMSLPELGTQRLVTSLSTTTRQCLPTAFESTVFIGVLPPYSHLEDFIHEADVMDTKAVGFSTVIKKPLDVVDLELTLSEMFPTNAFKPRPVHSKARNGWSLSEMFNRCMSKVYPMS